MRMYQLVLIAFFLIAAGCGPKVKIVRVDNEFLNNMSDEEIKKIETVEKRIVAIGDEQQAIRNLIRITQLEIQILKRDTELLEGTKSILINKENLYKIKSNSKKQKEAQQQIQNNNSEFIINGLFAQVLEARLADEKAQLESKGAELGQKIAERALMRAKIARVQQDKVFGDDPTRTGEKIDVSFFENKLKEKKAKNQEKGKLRLGTSNKYQVARSKHNQKKLTTTSSTVVPLNIDVMEESAVVPASPKITQLEMQILKQETELLEGKNSVLVDIERLFKFKNNSIKQKEAQQNIQKNKDEILIKGLISQVLEARLADEKAQLETMNAELEQQTAEQALKEAQNKKAEQDKAKADDPKKAGSKIDVSVFEKQLEEKKLKLQKNEKTQSETKSKLQEARNKLQETQNSPQTETLETIETQ